MVLCPVAIAVGCRKCPVFSVCPVKGVIGDYKKSAGDETQPLPKGEKKPAKRKKR